MCRLLLARFIERTIQNPRKTVQQGVWESRLCISLERMAFGGEDNTDSACTGFDTAALFQVFLYYFGRSSITGSRHVADAGYRGRAMSQSQFTSGQPEASLPKPERRRGLCFPMRRNENYMGISMTILSVYMMWYTCLQLCIFTVWPSPHPSQQCLSGHSSLYPAAPA
jgi:hypothetical protein